MTTHTALHPRDVVDRLYASGKEGGWEPTNLEDSGAASIERLEDYKHGGRLIAANRINTDNREINRAEITRK